MDNMKERVERLLKTFNRRGIVKLHADGMQEIGMEELASIVKDLWDENQKLKDALLDMIWQFSSNGDKLAHSFMSAEENAFDVLDVKNGMTYEEAEKRVLEE